MGQIHVNIYFVIILKKCIYLSIVYSIILILFREEKEIKEAAESSERKQGETEQDLIKAAEDAENTIKKEEELFKEISQSTMNVDDDLVNLIYINIVFYMLI